jgi:hypothetical protein
MLSGVGEASAHLAPHSDFRNLSISELLKSREAWHTPPTTMHNVIGIAIARCRFRDNDKAPVERRTATAEPRTFTSSHPDAWSRMTGREERGPNQYRNPDPRRGDGTGTHADQPLNPGVSPEFYKTSENDGNRAALPFRAHQVFELVCGIQDATQFACALGQLIHYCADGRNPAQVTRCGPGNKDWESEQRSKFHAVWNNLMFDSGKLVGKLTAELPKVPPIEDGVAEKVVAAMQATSVDLRPYADGLDFAHGIKAARGHAKTPECKTMASACMAGRAKLWWGLVLRAATKSGMLRRKWEIGMDMNGIYGEPGFLRSLGLDPPD